jgi:hypothetical protein
VSETVVNAMEHMQPNDARTASEKTPPDKKIDMRTNPNRT